jgi:hypothetical protein
MIPPKVNFMIDIDRQRKCQMNTNCPAKKESYSRLEFVDTQVGKVEIKT